MCSIIIYGGVSYAPDPETRQESLSVLRGDHGSDFRETDRLREHPPETARRTARPQ